MILNNSWVKESNGKLESIFKNFNKIFQKKLQQKRQHIKIHEMQLREFIALNFQEKSIQINYLSFTL